ncbi:unnamed protein product [Schistosoma turkestanicum]|nr:unnamed protein product [Schistosoma turkestanicum]
MSMGAFVVTDEERLGRLNDEARAKQNRELPFSPTGSHTFERFARKVFATEKPFQPGPGHPMTYTSGGNFLHRPVLDVPALQMGASWFTYQNVFVPRFCQIMERDFFRVGLQNTDKHCKIYWEDLLECRDHDKAVKKESLYDGKGQKDKEDGANVRFAVQRISRCQFQMTLYFPRVFPVTLSFINVDHRFQSVTSKIAFFSVCSTIYYSALKVVCFQVLVIQLIKKHSVSKLLDQLISSDDMLSNDMKYISNRRLN